MSGRTRQLRKWASACMLAGMVGTAAAQAPPGNVVPTAATALAGKVAAVVNDESIGLAELEAVLQQSGPSAVPIPADQQTALRRQALAMLIDDKLMQQFLTKNVPATPAGEVDKKLAEMDAELKKQGKGLAEFYRSSGQTEAQLRAGIGRSMQWQAYAKQNVTDAMVEQYYKDNKDFFDGVTVKASHIVYRVLPNAPAAEVASAREKLTAIRAHLVAGQLDFAAAAKSYSQCPSAPTGGDIGFFPRKWVVEEPFAKAAFALKVGEISDIVQTDYGLHLIKATERKPGQATEFAKIKDEVREFCSEEMRQALLAKMRKEAKIVVGMP